jgi:hypothetical protein
MKPILILLATASLGCGLSSEHFAPGEGSCTAVTLPAEAFALKRSSGGFDGRSKTQTFLSDGSLIDDDGRQDPVTKQLPGGAGAEATILSQLEETDVFDADQGCYLLEEPISDGTSADLAIRRGGAVFSFRGDALPDELDGAFQVLSARAAEAM